jgi:Protein of unknown function (DUF3108)
VAFAGGALYWLHGRGAAPPRAVAAEALAPAGKSVEIPEAPRTDAGRESEPTAAKVKNSAPVVVSGLPLRPGEVLDFTADVAKLSSVANLQLQVAERRTFLGKNAWHLQAFAHTENPLRMVFQLDDQFDSYSDAETMQSMQYEMHLSERGQKVDSVQRMTSTGKEPASGNATQARVLPGTRDPLGMMQFLRNTDWSKTHEVQGPVYDGHKLYDVRATLAGAGESIAVPAGTFNATKIDIRVFTDGAEMKDARFALYLAHNDARTPVLLEAILPWTTARVALKSSR